MKPALYTPDMTVLRGVWALASTLLVLVGCGSSDPSSDGSAGLSGLAGSVGGNAGASSSGAGGVTSSAGATSGAGATSTAGTSSAGAGGTSSAGAAGQAGRAGSGGSSGSANAGPSSSRQTAKPIGAGNGAPNGYFEYLPPGYDGSSATPLLVFWHGIGEDGNGGSELQKVLAHGPPGLISKDKWTNARPFIVLSPQYTPASGEIAAGGGCPSSATVDSFFTWALAHYEVDRQRVYLTGLSCGAIGSWDYLAQHQGAVVAAAVLLSGNPGVPTQAGSAWQRAGCKLGAAAIWSIHGDKDPTVPYAPDHDTRTNLIACPAPPRKAAVFTDVVNAGHDIWDSTYDLSAGHGDIYGWLLQNAR